MFAHKSERGQVLVLLALGMVGLIGLVALAIDGGSGFADRRHAQNAADNAAYAGSLAWIENEDWQTAARTIISSNGYTNTNSTHTLNISTTNTGCPDQGAIVTVVLNTSVDTAFAPIVGVEQIDNQVRAVARACKGTVQPVFFGNAVVALSRHGNAYEAVGTPDWLIVGGGIMSNAGAYRNGSAKVTAPSLTSVGTPVGFSVGTGTGKVGSVNTMPQMPYPPTNVTWPPTPACNGTANKVGTAWFPESGKEWSGSVISESDWAAGGVFATGLYCVTVSGNLNIHGPINGAGVTFYVKGNPTYDIKYNGGGALYTEAPSSGPYKGVAVFGPLDAARAGQSDFQMRGNGNAGLVGSILLPSTHCDMRGNSGTSGLRSQVVCYTVDTGGGAAIYINYNANENYKAPIPPSIELTE